MTTQFRFHRSFPPSRRKQASHDETRAEDDTFIILSHRNELGSSIHTSLYKILREKKEGKRDRKRRKLQTDHTSEEASTGLVPPWVSEMVVEEEARAYQVLITADHTSGPSKATKNTTIPRKRYREVQSNTTFGEALRDLTVVEFPIFEIVPRGNYNALLEGVEEDASREDEVRKLWAFDEDENEEDEDIEERPRKKRKVDPEAGKRLFGGLTAYGEDDDDEGSNPSALVAGTQPSGLALAYSSEESEESGSEDTVRHLDAPAELDEVDWD